MSRLDELIQKLYPDGVESKNLEECCTVLDRKRKPVTKAARENGEYPYYGANGIQDYVSDYIFDGTFVLVGEDGSVITSQGTPVVNWAEGKIWVNNHAHIIEEKNGVLLRYLYHYLQTVDVTHLIHGNIPKLTGGDFKALTVPVPPLEVQREIVRILDSFMLLTAELTAELTARKSQYEFYRDELLKVDGSIKTVALEEIADIGTGSSNTNEGLEEGLYPFYVRSQEPLRKNEYEYDETAIITAGDGVGVGKVYHYVEGKYALHQRAYRIHINTPEVLPKYYFHYMKSTFLPYIQKTMFQGSVASIRRPMLNKFPVPVPSLEVQKKIIDVLENFESICNDLNIGLPAEIEARQKQYEYYRDALLTYASTGKIIAQTDRQTDRQTSIIKLIQFVYGSVRISLKNISKHSSSGSTPKKGNSAYYEGGTIPWLRTQDVRFNEIYDTTAFITELAVKETSAKWIPENCVIVAISGASAGRCAINKISLTTNQHCLNIEIDPNMALYKYVFYCVCSQHEELLSRKEGARGDLNASRILSLEVPLPSLSEQERIVGILDRFDTLCNDLSIGLPAEIEARQKQYEYYRDRLLNFEPITK